MTKQIRYIIITVCILAVLGVLLVLMKFLPGKKISPSSSGSSSSAVTLTNIDDTKVVSVRVTNDSGSFTIRKSGDNWAVDELSAYPINQSTVKNIVDEVRAVTAQANVDTGSSGLEPFGLGSPRVSAELTSSDGKTLTLLVGSKTPMQDGYYAMMKGDDKVYIVTTSIGDDLSNPAQKLIDLTLTTIDQTKYNLLSSIVLAGPGRNRPVQLDVDAASLSSYSQATDSNGNVLAPVFKVTKPGSYDANTETINSTVTALSALSANEIISLDYNDKLLEQYGLKNPKYTLTYTFDKKNTTLSFGNTFQKDGTEYVYVTVSGKNLIFDISTSTANFYNYSLMDVCSGNVMIPADINTVKTITVAAGSNSWTYDLSGTGDSLKPTNSGKALNLDQFRIFYEQLNYLIPEGLADKASNASLLCRITYTFQDSSAKKPVTVEFYTLPDPNDATKVDQYRALVSVDGNANFYLKRTKIDNIVQYCQDIISGKTIPGI